MGRLPSRLQLALPFTYLTAANRVRLVAGEDFRFTLEGPCLETWLPGWLPTFDGEQSLDDVINRLPSEHRESARQIVERLYGERVLVEAAARTVHQPLACYFAPEGCGPLLDLLRRPTAAADATAIPVLCQDQLDYEAALRFNRRCLAGKSPWFWTTTGPMSRAYVSPAFLPDAGPCLECLVRVFRRLSPIPEVYDELIDHAAGNGVFAAAPFPSSAVEIVRQLLLAKLNWLALDQPPAALYQLHVIEAARLEVSIHRVFSDPDCPACDVRR